ncbi:mCG22278 [Mus musculus]|jgi:fatty acid-binding protein 5|nr:mCG22278 [Mus musculus]
MASLKDLEGKWRLMESHGFEEYAKELGVGLALRKMAAMAKPDSIITCDGNNITIKTESTVKTTVFSCTLGEKFDETMADGRKTEMVCTFQDGALVQHQQWEGEHDNRKTEGWEVDCGACHEQCHLHSGLREGAMRASSSSWTGVSCQSEYAQFSERT